LGTDNRKRLIAPEKVFARKHADRRPAPQESNPVDGAQKQVEHKKDGYDAKISAAKYVPQVERIDQGDEFSACLPVLLEPVGIRTLRENSPEKEQYPKYGEKQE
jgi:hypothetical protein